ncbi:hypothetical protein B0H34DRAFT_796826 [Crassisporium funariophilum]|nr:hypothetical protein B0H34DRAFT_796826 [Crassisporium funariophilum]
MSAVRNLSNRAEARKKRASPYSGRAVLNSVGRYFGLIRKDDDEDAGNKITRNDTQTTSSTTSSTSHITLQNSDHEMALPEPQNDDRPPLTPVENFNGATTSTPERPHAGADIGGVAAYLSESTGRAVSSVEVEGMLAMLRSDTPPGNQEPFRFSLSTPIRESVPPSRTALGETSTPSATPRKTLLKNPNGVYRWDGAGSAKRSRTRNRHASPAFGTSPIKSERLVMKESAGLSDNKRRKVQEDISNGHSSSSHPLESETSTRKVPFPTSSPATPRSNGVNGKLSSSSRLRTPVKPTAPVVPSPLRQAWSDGSSTSSQNDARTSPSYQPKQTKAASFMAELIKETTPPKKPDLSNPYQSASPVSQVGPPRRNNRRVRSTGRPTPPSKEELAEEKRKIAEAKEEEKMKQYSSQAIIEATVPKGSKRSRPPVHFESSPESASETPTRLSPPAQREAPVVVETRKVTYTVEEVDEDLEGSARSAKRMKPSVSGRGPAPLTAKYAVPPQNSEITIEEIDDVDMQGPEKEDKLLEQPKVVIPVNGNGSSTSSSGPSPTSRSAFAGPKASSIPKEPSKLRYSFQAESSAPSSRFALPSAPLPSAPLPSAPLPSAPLPSAPIPSAPLPSVPLPSAPVSPPKSNIAAPSSEFSFSYKPLDKSSSQASTSGVKVSKVASVANAKAKALAVKVGSLPVYLFTLSATVASDSPDHLKARDEARAVPLSSLPTYNLAVGPVTSSTSFSFGFDPANPKPRPQFNFAAPKTSSSPPKASFPTGNLPVVGGTSFFKSGESVAKTPSMVAPPPGFNPGPVKGFDFAAAGMKPPTASKDTWTCTLCALKNPMSASKCETCETPSPVSSGTTGTAVAARTISPFAVPSVVPVPVKGFDFAAAGMKPPAISADTWKCSQCGLMNPKVAKQCETCEAPCTVFS